jgi:hypothetical protein
MVDRTYTAIGKARALGTLNEIDRAKQYSEANTSDLLRSLNEAWSKIRLVEAANIRKDAEIAQLHAKLNRSQLVNIALTSIITGLAWEGLKMLISAIQ